jgi:hydroxyacylglutathione hydrolase
LSVPGHTRGHLAYYGSGCLFCGDTLFAGGCGRVFEGPLPQMHDSLTRLSELPEQTAVYCGHEYTELNLRFALTVEPGNRRLRERVEEVAALRASGRATVPSTLALEKATNPFLRCDSPEIVDAVTRRAAPDLLKEHDFSRAPGSVFSILREWKNHF